MNAITIFWPMLTLVLLTLLLYVPLGARKFKAVKNRQVDLKRTALEASAWTEDVCKINNNLRNLYEAPMLFYVVCITLFVTEQVSLLTLSLAWLYVLSRCVHSYIHTTSNFVPMRMRVFVVSTVILIVLLVVTMIGLF